MKLAGMALCLAALAAIACGCPQTGMEVGGGETKLLEKFKEEGDKQKATILFVISRGCGPDSATFHDYLKGIKNYSDGTVKLVNANADTPEDADVKKAYGFTTYPVTLVFDEKGDLVERYESARLDPEIIKKKVIELGAKIRNRDEPPPEPEDEAEVEPEKPAETPAETPEEKPEEAPEEAPEEGGSGE
jgi:hypothetical protein